MTLTTEAETDLVCQMTQHAMLVAWGRFARQLAVSQRLRSALSRKRHQDACPLGDLILELGLASLAGLAYLRDLNLGAQPLIKDQAVADAWDIQFRHYTQVSRVLAELTEATVAEAEGVLVAVMSPYLRRAVHEVLCQQAVLTLCGDLTGRPVSATSTTYPPEAVFGYMARQLCRGHQAALVTLKGVSHRVHVTTFQRPGDTVSKSCLRQMVDQTEQRLGCRPQRRTALVKERLVHLEAKIAQTLGWAQAQERLVRQHLERQVRLQWQLDHLAVEIVRLEADYQGKEVRPRSLLSQARQRQAGWLKQCQSARRQEAQARQVLTTHQARLDQLRTQREQVAHYLAQLEADNATLVYPVRMRWLLDGAFSDGQNLSYLIELGYDVYTIGNGQTTLALLEQLPPQAPWERLRDQIEALEMPPQPVGECPYPLRLTLLRWSSDQRLRHSTLLSFSDQDKLPLSDLFMTYQQRQDVEAGIKQGKSVFSFTKLRLRSAAGIALLGQFALFFWPNFVHWAAEWLAHQVQQPADPFAQLLQHVRTQVRIAAHTPAVVLTTPAGQLLQFDPDGPLTGVEINLDGPLAYQLPMPLFQAWEQLWPISASSVKEHLATLTATQQRPLVAQIALRPP